MTLAASASRTTPTRPTTGKSPTISFPSSPPCRPSKNETPPVTIDHTDHLAAATRRRATATRDRARAALHALDRAGSPINYVTVAKTAGVSRALHYRDPELREQIDKLRDVHRTNTPRQPAAQRMTPASRDELFAGLRNEARALRTENNALRARLAIVLGDERAAIHQPPPRPADDPVTDMSLTRDEPLTCANTAINTDRSR